MMDATQQVEQIPPQAPEQPPAPAAPAAPEAAPAKEKSMLPTIGGVLLIVTAVLGIAMAALWISAGSILDDLADIPGVGDLADILEDIIVAMGVVGLIFSLVVLLGGVMAMRRKGFGMAIIGGVFALIVGLFTPYAVGSVLGLVGLILIAISHKEFK